MPTKRRRGYSREFRPIAGTGRRYLLDAIPAGLWREATTKAKREGVSMRALILSQLEAYVSDEDTKGKKR